MPTRKCCRVVLPDLVGAGDDREPAGEVRRPEVVVDPVAVDVPAVDPHDSAAVIASSAAAGRWPRWRRCRHRAGGRRGRGRCRREQPVHPAVARAGPASSMERRRSAVKSSRRRMSMTSSCARVLPRELVPPREGRAGRRRAGGGPRGSRRGGRPSQLLVERSGAVDGGAHDERPAAVPGRVGEPLELLEQRAEVPVRLDGQRQVGEADPVERDEDSARRRRRR